MRRKPIDRQAEISAEFDKFLEDLETLIKDGASLSSEELSLVKEKLQERVVRAKETARRVGDEVAESAVRMAHNANEQVHEEPWKAIGAGAALGLLLGLLVARR